MEIVLDKFEPRDYQLPVCTALEGGKYKKLLLVWCRRAGKDYTCWNLLTRAAFFRIGTYFYVWPTYTQGKKAFWDAMTISGQRFLDFIPKELIKSINSTEMKIELLNGSILQVVGSESYDRLRGSNPIGVVFSEYAYSDPTAYKILRPVLLANDGWCIIESTPNGDNFFHDIYKMAVKSEDWFTSFLTVNDTQHISKIDIEKEIQSGEMSHEMAMQEYYCSFNYGVSGSIYSSNVQQMINEGRTTTIPWNPNKPVHTAWDLGIDDSEVIIFFQVVNNCYYIIDYLEDRNKGLSYYVKLLKNKPYNYGTHLAPHDIKVREQTRSDPITGRALSRQFVAKELGINFSHVPNNLSLKDQQEAVKALFPRVYIDGTKCERLISAMNNHRRTYDIAKNKYSDKPLHDWTSHAESAFRMMTLGTPLFIDKKAKTDHDKLRREAMAEEMYYR